MISVQESQKINAGCTENLLEQRGEAYRVEHSADQVFSYSKISHEEDRSYVKEFYDGRSILVTGGSGFLGKVLIEKLLRSCPDLSRIFVLIRPKRDKKPRERLEELLKIPLFAALGSPAELLEKIVVVEGDVSRENLGMSDDDLRRVRKEVSVIFHSAATVKFDAPMKQSVEINIAGTKHVVDLCRTMKQLASLVHVSTAYANCDRGELYEHVYLNERDVIDPYKLIRIAEMMPEDTLQLLKAKLIGDRPNTYTYTKSMAEWLLIESARDLPVVICRPSIVTASWKEPFAGWVDNLNGPTGVILGVGKGLLRSMHADPDCRADLIPVDTCASMLVALGWFARLHHLHKESLRGSYEIMDSILADSIISSSSSSSASDELEDLQESSIDSDFNEAHSVEQSSDVCGSSDCLSLGSSCHLDQTIENGSERESTTVDYRYLSKLDRKSRSRGHQDFRDRDVKPKDLHCKLKQFRDRNLRIITNNQIPERVAEVPVFHCTSGSDNPITWGVIQILSILAISKYPSISVFRFPSGAATTNKWLDKFYRLTLHYIPALIYDFCASLGGGKQVLFRTYRRFNKESEILLSFVLKQWIFDPSNSRSLIRDFMSSEDRKLFNFGVEAIDWKQYFENYQLGIRSFILKEPPENLELARFNLRITYYRNLMIQVLLTAVFMFIMVSYLLR